MFLKSRFLLHFFLSAFFQIICSLPRLYTFLTTALKQAEDSSHHLVKNQKDFCSLLLVTLLEPSTLGFRLTATADRDALATTCVQLLKSIRSAWPDFYTKLQLYLKQAYWHNDLLSVESAAQRVLSAPVDLDALRGYKALAAHGLLAADMNLDAVSLMQKILERLPEEGTVLRRLPPERVEQLTVLIDLLSVLSTSAAVEAFVRSLTMPNVWSAKLDWFLAQCGASFAKQLLAGASSALSPALAADFTRFLRLLSTLVAVVTAADSNVSRSESDSLVDFVTEHWDRIAGSMESRSDILRAVFVVQTLGRLMRPEKARPAIAGWFCRLLRHPTADFKAKVKTFRLLGLVAAAAGTADVDEELRSALLTFGSLHLPVNSRELPEDSLQQNLYKNLFRQIMAVFEQIGAASLLYFLISIAARETEHVLEAEVQAALSRAMANAAAGTPDRQQGLLAVPWTIYADTSGTFNCTVRLACLGRFLLPMVTAATVATITRFFTQHMRALLSGVTAEVRGSAESRLAALTLKIGAVQLFGMLYSRLDQGQLHAPGAPLVGLAANILREKDLFKGKGDGKDLTLFLLKAGCFIHTYKSYPPPHRNFHFLG
jgi:hypothetical protein